MAKKTKRKSINYKVVSLVVILLLLIGVAAWRLHSHPKQVSIIPATKTNNQIASGSNSGGSSTAAAPSGDKTAASTGFSSPSQTGSGSSSGGAAPITPSAGSLVSNHMPTSANSSEQSVCATSPGASCYIAFTQGDVVKQLPAQTTDSTGAAYWTWDVYKDAKLTNGTWDISVVATLNGQTKSASDSTKLTVQ